MNSTRKRWRAISGLCGLAAALALGDASAQAGAAAPSDSSVAAPPVRYDAEHRRRFFALAYCGPGRDESGSLLHDLDWAESVRGFGLTIVPRMQADYRKLAKLRQAVAPDHEFLLYVHAHALFSHDDRAGALNLREENFLHATDPADLRITSLESGLLLDWMPDERVNYDTYGVLSLGRAFSAEGYRVARREAGGVAVELAALEPLVTAYVDTTAVPGVDYEYWVKTVAVTGHVISYSFPQSARWQPAAQPVVIVRDHMRGVGAAVDSAHYGLRVRVRVEGAVERCVLLVDRNADKDYDDAGELVLMEQDAEGRYEAITRLDAAGRTAQDLHRIFGFPYQIRVDGAGQTVTLPASGHYTTSVNNRIRSRRYGFFVMRPLTPMWIDHLVRRVRAKSRRAGDIQGLFLDELLSDMRIQADAEPVDMTAVEFRQQGSQLADSLKAAYPQFKLYYNGLGQGTDPPACDGGMIEGFAVAPWHRYHSGRVTFAPPAIWEGQLGAALDMAWRGREVLLMTRNSAIDRHDARLFAYASFLLAETAGVRFSYAPASCGTRPLPEFDVPLGEPLVTYKAIAEAANGEVYWRPFARGAVFVNPSLTAAQVTLERASERLRLAGDGLGRVAWDTLGALIELEPQSGAIVRWSE